MRAGEERVGVTLIANAGLLLEYRGMKLLLDGIFSGEGHPFGAIPEELWERELSGQPPFDGVQYLLFTHRHPDHFSLPLTREYLRRNAVKGVLMPERAYGGEPEELPENGKTARVPLPADAGQAVFRLREDISVQVIRTRHLDKRFIEVEHCCYLISFGEKRLLFTGDADYVTESFDLLRDIRLDAVFLNPLFFSAVCRGRFFTGSFDTGLYCVYHLPPAGEDAMTSNRSVLRELERWDERRGRAVILNESNRSLEI